MDTQQSTDADKSEPSVASASLAELLSEYDALDGLIPKDYRKLTATSKTVKTATTKVEVNAGEIPSGKPDNHSKGKGPSSHQTTPDQVFAAPELATSAVPPSHPPPAQPAVTIKTEPKDEPPAETKPKAAHTAASAMDEHAKDISKMTATTAVPPAHPPPAQPAVTIKPEPKDEQPAETKPKALHKAASAMDEHVQDISKVTDVELLSNEEIEKRVKNQVDEVKAGRVTRVRLCT